MFGTEKHFKVEKGPKATLLDDVTEFSNTWHTQKSFSIWKDELHSGYQQNLKVRIEFKVIDYLDKFVYKKELIWDEK